MTIIYKELINIKKTLVNYNFLYKLIDQQIKLHKIHNYNYTTSNRKYPQNQFIQQKPNAWLLQIRWTSYHHYFKMKHKTHWQIKTNKIYYLQHKIQNKKSHNQK